MINKEKREELAENNPDMLFFDNPSFDNSIIGLSDDDRVIYDFNKMIYELAGEDEISLEEAQEFIEVNTLRSLGYAGENRPIILFPNLD